MAGAFETVTGPIEKRDRRLPSPQICFEFPVQDIVQASSTSGPLTPAVSALPHKHWLPYSMPATVYPAAAQVEVHISIVLLALSYIKLFSDVRAESV